MEMLAFKIITLKVESKHKQVTGMFANIWDDPINQSVIQEGPE